tara:strand:- start:10585 stop:11310 length:726 start_codon:yes stop_codon:yes gene_type:complete
MRSNVPKMFGVPRSGGTLIYNIIDYLWGGQASPQKHNYFSSDEKVIATYRDFRDCCTSHWRTFTLGLRKEGFDESSGAKKMTVHEMVNHAQSQKTTVQHLNFFKNDVKNKDREVLFLKYEDFFDSEKGDVNFDFLLEKLENFLEIKITDEEKKYIQKEFCFSSQKKESKNYKDFHDGWNEEEAGYEDLQKKGLIEKLHKRHIHGHHLYTGKNGTWKSLVPEQYHALITDILANELKEWGYI